MKQIFFENVTEAFVQKSPSNCNVQLFHTNVTKRTPIVNYSHIQCLSDTYDAVLCVGAYSSTHISYICYDSQAAINKPGNKFVRKIGKH